jgi:hypothetical protein
MGVANRKGKGEATNNMSRYAAKLLFQYRVMVDGDPGKRRFCEERIINFPARSPREALSKAQRRGKKAEHSYPNDDGNTVSFEFVGIMDMLHLDPETEADEVWYDVHNRLLPMERRDKLIPPDEWLLQQM